MTQIVVNRCFGGFGLSPKAVKAIYMRKGISLYSYKGDFSIYTNIDGKEHEYTNNCIFYSTINKPILTSDEMGESSVYEGNLERTDPDLIYVVGKLGEDANGRCADLEIVSIPDDICWSISDYDGSETVHESHRSW